MNGFRVGIDVGGTFTDIVFLAADGVLHTKKISSSVDDYARSIVEGVEAVMQEQGVTSDQIEAILHGTTVASNAILERKGAKTGLITTRGFRDVLEIRNLRIPRLYNIGWRKPPPLVERRLRVEVAERINAAGQVLQPLDEVDVRDAVRQLVGEGVEAIAIVLLNSYANPAHENMVARILGDLCPGLPFCTSSAVLPEIREYERTSTTTINTYVKPVVSRYLQRLKFGLTQLAIKSPLWLMQSNGGLLSAETAAEMPMHIIESGPAGGVIGAQAIARTLGIPDIISFDMGGTTAKASLIENGQVTRAQEYHVGGGILTSSRLLAGDGYLLKVPAVDLAEVGAGGGSIVQIDDGGGLKVGPRSAGATPGPLCYDIGGEEPTITDANLILGYINPDHLVGGEVKLNASRAHRIFEEKISKPLGVDLPTAAYGAHRIVVANMIRAVRSVSTERGRDPRRYALFAFGGNGPLFASLMARELSVRHVIVPPAAGLFSSFGFLYADVESHFSKTLRALLSVVDPVAVEAAFVEIEATAASRLADAASAPGTIERQVTLRYRGQSLELPLPVGAGRIDSARIAALAREFEVEHERTFGHAAQAGEPVELVTVRVMVRLASEGQRVPVKLAPSRSLQSIGRAKRDCFFGASIGWMPTRIVQRAELAERQDGPLIVEEYDSTCVIPPGTSAWLDTADNIHMEVSLV